MKRITSLLLWIALPLLMLSSCEEDSSPAVKLSKLSFPAETITLMEGETYMLKVLQEPQQLAVDLIYSNDNPDIATVNSVGQVQAIHEGETKVTVYGGGQQASVLISVQKRRINTDQELPLLVFQPKYDLAHNLIDEEVLAHERSLGRVVRNICYSEGYYYLGFVNKELPTIPGVIYGIESSKGYYILAYSKEEVEHSERTQGMFRKLGFAPFVEEREETGDGGEKIILKSYLESDRDITVFMYNEVNEDLQTKMYIEITQRKYPEFQMKHPLIETAQDFPTLDFFKDATNEQLETFETSLGFRKFNERQSSEENRSYDTTPEQVERTNLEWVFYIRKSGSQGEIQYINTQVFALPNEREIRSEAVKNWLAINGFTDYKGYVPEHKGVEAFNAQGDQCFIYAHETEYDGTFCWMQILDSEHAVKTEQARKAFRAEVESDIQHMLNRRLLSKRTDFYQVIR